MNTVLVLYQKGDEAQKHNGVILLYDISNGVFGANSAAREQFGKGMFCFDDLEAMGAQAYFAILSQYDRDHPGSRDLNAGLVLTRAMAERYPCLK